MRAGRAGRQVGKRTGGANGTGTGSRSCIQAQVKPSGRVSRVRVSRLVDGRQKNLNNLFYFTVRFGSTNKLCLSQGLRHVNPPEMT